MVRFSTLRLAACLSVSAIFVFSIFVSTIFVSTIFVSTIFAADPGGTLPGKPILRFTSNGDLIVRGTGTSVVSYTANEPPRVEGLRISFPDSRPVRLEVPRGMRLLELVSTNGIVDVADMDGSVRASVGAGQVVVDRINGDAEIHSLGGPAVIGSVGGLVRCYTAGGKIKAAVVRGKGTFETGGGDIEIGQVMGTIRAITAGGAIQIRNAGGEVFADTYGGPIEILRALGMVIARSAGGPIQVEGAPSAQCESSSGTIRLNNVSGRLLASTMRGSIVAEILAGHPLQDSALYTAAGDISVSIPSNLGVTVLARYDGPGSRNSILCDFPGLTLETAGGGVIARGKINGGGPVLKLTGAGGRIQIKRK